MDFDVHLAGLDRLVFVVIERQPLILVRRKKRCMIPRRKVASYQ